MNVGSKIKEIKSMPQKDRPRVIIVERNARTQLLVVQETAKENGFVDEEQLSVLRSIYAMIPSDFDIRIFVRTSPETCSNRIKQRGRAFEDTFSKEVLQGYHQKMVLSHDTLQRSECRYKAVIDGEQSQSAMKERFVEILKDREGKFNQFEE